MHDNVHGFEITYEIDPTTGRIVRAEHVTPRLPYMGICSEPQRKIAALLGETVDDGLRRRIQSHIGGETGCARTLLTLQMRKGEAVVDLHDCVVKRLDVPV